MDSSTLQELNKSPFGRELHVITHRLPRACKAGADWELERGFYLEVVGEDLFEFTLAARSPQTNSLPLWADANTEGQERFLIWHSPRNYKPEEFETFATALNERPQVAIGLILSHSSRRGQALLDFPKYRRVWRSVNQPVLQIFQDYPPKTYFAVEKSLFDLGRVGRRLKKLSKIRRLMPW